MIATLTDLILSSALHETFMAHSWIFPTAETVHFMALTLFFGVLLILDLRGMGFYKQLDFKVAHQFVPVVLIAFAFIVCSGLTFIMIDPERYFVNIAFQLKMGLLLIAGLNALLFEFFVFKPVLQGAQNIETSFRAKLISGASLVIWISVLILGRSIPYVEV